MCVPQALHQGLPRFLLALAHFVLFGGNLRLLVLVAGADGVVEHILVREQGAHVDGVGRLGASGARREERVVPLRADPAANG